MCRSCVKAGGVSLIMKTLNIHFTDEEFKKLTKAKSETMMPYSWHSFILMKCAKGVSVKKKLKTMAQAKRDWEVNLE